MKKVLITGGTGFIGYYLAKELISRNIEVIIYDSFISFQTPLKSKYSIYLNERMKLLEKNTIIIRGDIRHKIFFEKIIDEHKPDIIIHLAALSVADVSNEFSEEAMQHNLNGTVSILEVIKNKDFIERFIYTSSSMIYGDFINEPVDENHPKNPKDIYGATKYSGEIMLRAFHERFGINYVIIRPSAVYGPLDANCRVSQIFIDNAFEDQPLYLDNGGYTRLDFTFVEDLSKGFILACEKKEALNSTFNMTRGEARSLRELADIISVHFPEIKIKERTKEVFRPKRGALSIEKARNKLGYKPEISLEKGIEIYIDYLRKFKNIY